MQRRGINNNDDGGGGKRSLIKHLPAELDERKHHSNVATVVLFAFVAALFGPIATAYLLTNAAGTILYLPAFVTRANITVPIGIGYVFMFASNLTQLALTLGSVIPKGDNAVDEQASIKDKLTMITLAILVTIDILLLYANLQMPDFVDLLNSGKFEKMSPFWYMGELLVREPVGSILQLILAVAFSIAPEGFSALAAKKVYALDVSTEWKYLAIIVPYWHFISLTVYVIVGVIASAGMFTGAK